MFTFSPSVPSKLSSFALVATLLVGTSCSSMPASGTDNLSDASATADDASEESTDAQAGCGDSCALEIPGLRHTIRSGQELLSLVNETGLHFVSIDTLSVVGTIDLVSPKVLDTIEDVAYVLTHDATVTENGAVEASGRVHVVSVSARTIMRSIDVLSALGPNGFGQSYSIKALSNDRFVIATSDGLAFFDAVSGELEGTVVLGDGPNYNDSKMHYRDNRLYVTRSYYSRLSVVDTLSMTLVAEHLNLPGVNLRDVLVADNRAFVTTDTGLGIVDLSVPETVFQPSPDLFYLRSIFHAPENRLYGLTGSALAEFDAGGEILCETSLPAELQSSWMSPRWGDRLVDVTEGEAVLSIDGVGLHVIALGSCE